MTPTELYQAAQNGQKLTPQERRKVIANLEEAGEMPSNYELAALFQVDEKVIRRDRKRVLRHYAAQITPAQAMTFVAKYLRTQERLLNGSLQGLAKAQPGTTNYFNYAKLASDLQERILTKLQAIGIVPKEFGGMAVTKEAWVAEFSDAGVASVRPDDGTSVSSLSEGAPIDSDATLPEGEEPK